jgi:RNA polymerase sigma-70 factor (ECF subfamily)
LALGELRHEYRQAFLLFHQQELNYDQIATTMDRPIGTIKTWIHRARRELIDFLRRREVIRERCDEMRRV